MTLGDGISSFKSSDWPSIGSQCKDTLSNIVLMQQEGIPVRAVSLDTYFSRLQPPIFVKVDMEGYEESVAHGSPSLIDSWFPLVWQLELGNLSARLRVF